MIKETKRESGEGGEEFSMSNQCFKYYTMKTFRSIWFIINCIYQACSLTKIPNKSGCSKLCVGTIYPSIKRKKEINEISIKDQLFESKKAKTKVEKENNFLQRESEKTGKKRRKRKTKAQQEQQEQQEQTLKSMTKQETEHKKTGKKKKSHRRAKCLNKFKYCKESETQLPESVNLEVK